MLEAYKNVDGLAAAWRRVATSVPDALLVIVGKGTRGTSWTTCSGTCPARSSTTRSCFPRRSPRKLDEATVLVLPSWPEGLGRVDHRGVRAWPRCRRNGCRWGARSRRERGGGNPDSARRHGCARFRADACAHGSATSHGGLARLRTSATRTGTRRRRALHARRAISWTSRWHATAAAEPVRLDRPHPGGGCRPPGARTDGRHPGCVGAQV